MHIPEFQNHEYSKMVKSNKTSDNHIALLDV